MNEQAQISPDWTKKASKIDVNINPYIGGKHIQADGDTFEKVNPANGKSNRPIMDGKPELAAQAVSSAKAAFHGEWGQKAPAERREILLIAAELLRGSAEEVALLDSVEMGKPMSASMGDAHVAAGFVQYYAEAIDKSYGATAPGAKGFLETQIFEPRGVVAAIIPWNFPIINAAMKAGPALAAGNSVVLKPSEHGTYSSLRFAEILTEAGLPDGALNVVTGGRNISQALVKDSGIDLITFTGSTQTGQAVMAATASTGLTPVMLECGGKNPHILFEDAFRSEMGQAISGFIANMSMWNSGQVCVARSRLLVEKSIYEDVVGIMEQICGSMAVGDPLQPETQLGPLAFRSQYDRAMGCIEKGASEGAKLVVDGRNPKNVSDGCYVAPTVFADGGNSKTVWNEEIFGPVLAIDAFDGDADALAKANDTPYGLAATVWTNDFSRAHRLAEGLDVGKVSVQTRPAMPDGCWPAHSAEPAGQSGFGIEGGMEALKSYSRLKSTQFIY